jgi:phosphoadenosine phosphosulfate reductase
MARWEQIELSADKIAALLHARRPSFRRRVQESREIIAEALEKGNPYIALSGGKDSTVLMALVHEQNLTIPAVWSDDEWYLPETEAYINRVRASGVDMRRIRSDVQHSEWFCSHGDIILSDYIREQNFELVFLGLRAAEANYRRVHLRVHGSLFYAHGDNLWHCNPLANWTVDDVWAYIYSHNLDYNLAYDKLAEMGLPPERQRIGPLAVERVIGFGQLAILKRGWPSLFNRFSAEYPEARRYT